MLRSAPHDAQRKTWGRVDRYSFLVRIFHSLVPAGFIPALQGYALKKIAYIRRVYHLKSRFGRLREQGLLTAKEMSQALGVSESTVHNWAQSV